jgi:hypothetical protein
MEKYGAVSYDGRWMRRRQTAGRGCSLQEGANIPAVDWKMENLLACCKYNEALVQVEHGSRCLSAPHIFTMCMQWFAGGKTP